jgi:hypothetical protein
LERRVRISACSEHEARRKVLEQFLSKGYQVRKILANECEA